MSKSRDRLWSRSSLEKILVSLLFGLITCLSKVNPSAVWCPIGNYKLRCFLQCGARLGARLQQSSTNKNIQRLPCHLKLPFHLLQDQASTPPSSQILCNLTTHPINTANMAELQNVAALLQDTLVPAKHKQGWSLLSILVAGCYAGWTSANSAQLRYCSSRRNANLDTRYCYSVSLLPNLCH